MSFSGLPNHEANALEGRRLLKLSRRRILLTITMAALLGLGMFLRIFPSSGFKRVGFDEHGYMVFVKQIQAPGVWNYGRAPSCRRRALPSWRRLPLSERCFNEFRALRPTAITAGVLMLLLCALFAYRLGHFP